MPSNQPSATMQSLFRITRSPGATARIAVFTLTTKPTFSGWRR